MSRPSREAAGGRAYLDLQARARREGRPTDELLVLYILERFLYRVSASAHRDRLVLKGGMLLAAFDERRPTADVDLLARNLLSEVEAVAALVREVLMIEVDDGVVFAPDDLRAELIRETDVYAGVRIVVPAAVARARHPLRVDVNVGDPVTPGPVEVAYPALLGEPFTVVGYPLETVLAEKIVTMVDRGDATTRERDFADVFVLMTPRHRCRIACRRNPGNRRTPRLGTAPASRRARHLGPFETARLDSLRRPQRPRGRGPGGLRPSHRGHRGLRRPDPHRRRAVGGMGSSHAHVDGVAGRQASGRTALMYV